MNTLEARIQQLEEQLSRALQENQQLKLRIEELEEKLNTNSKNSSKPPSQDLYRGKKSKKVPSERKQGGQVGRKGVFRKPFRKKEVSEVIEINPKKCPECKGSSFKNPPIRTEIKQVADLPEIKLSVNEYHINTCKCSQCGENIKGETPRAAKRAFGPKVMGFLTLLTGEYSLSKRKIADLLGHLNLKISLGSICHIHHLAGEILEEPYDKIKEVTLNGKAVNADETSWRTKGAKRWVWIATSSKSAYYKIDPSRSREAFSRIIGSKFQGTLTTDRYGAYNAHEGKRQRCLSHVRRDIEKISDRSGIDGMLGGGLKDSFNDTFSLWKAYKSGCITRKELIAGTEVFSQQRVKALLQLGSVGGGLTSKTRGTCKNLLKSFDGLWVYLYEEGIDPTNNLAERDLRQGVLWRKISNGTQSDAGERFVERILTVSMTLKKQSKNTLTFLVDCFHSYIREGPMPQPL